MEWAQSIRPQEKTPPSLHDHLASHSALTSLEHGLAKWLLIGGVAALAIALVPIILPELGIGGGVLALLDDACCTLVGLNRGIAGGIAVAVESLPVVGTYLAEKGAVKMFAPAITMLGGQAVGHLISHFEHKAGKQGTIGSAVRITSMAIGVVLALPIILPAVGHGVHFLSRLVGADAFGVAAAQFLGNTSVCVTDATAAGLIGGGATLAAHLPCALPAIAASFPLLAPHAAKTSKKKLATGDPNHHITAGQQAWIDAYNQAPPEQKAGLQKVFREKGYDPDFHPDGTMHLYRHAAAMVRR